MQSCEYYRAMAHRRVDCFKNAMNLIEEGKYQLKYRKQFEKSNEMKNIDNIRATEFYPNITDMKR